MTALWVVALLQGLVIVFIVAEVGKLRRTAENAMGAAGVQGPEIGLVAPTFEARDGLSGTHVSSSDFTGERLAFLFLNSECGDCRRVMVQLAKLSAHVRSHLVLYCSGLSSRCLSKLPVGIPFRAVLVESEEDAIGRFNWRTLPALVLIDDEMKVQKYRYIRDATEIDEFLTENGQIDGGEEQRLDRSNFPAKDDVVLLG